MDKANSSRTPLVIAVVLLLLPVFYVLSYLLLVWPDGERFLFADSRSDFPVYRFGTESWAGHVFWPLEKLDRRVRPGAWQQPAVQTITIGPDGLERIGVDFGP